MPDYFWVPVARVAKTFSNGTFVVWTAFLGEDTKPRVGGHWFNGEPDYVLFSKTGAPVLVPQPDDATCPYLAE